MSHPGDPADSAGRPHLGSGAYEYPAIEHGDTPPPEDRSPTNGLAIGSLVSALVGIPVYFMHLGFLGSFIGIVLGIAALNQIRKQPQRGSAMAIGGIALGTLCIVGMGVLSLVLGPSEFLY